MGKLLLPTLFLFLALWLLGGSWWFADRYYQQNVTGNTLVPASTYPNDKSNTDDQEQIAQGTPIKIRPSNLLFKDQKDDIQLTPALNQYFADLKQYLQTFSEAKVVLTGYTDNRGTIKSNVQLSKNRANNVRQFMIDLGFNEHQLITQFRGSKDPVASNATEAGRIKNRRVEIRIK